MDSRQMNVSRTFRRMQAMFAPPPERMPPLSRQLYFLWRRRFTASGRMLLLVLLLTAPTSASVTINYPLYYFSIFVFSTVVVALLAGAVYKPRRVKIRRSLPERVAAGATVTVRATVTNAGRLPAYDLAVSEYRLHSAIWRDREPVYLDTLMPGETAEVTYTLTPTRRGAYDFQGPMAMTGFPFGLYNAIRFQTAPHRMLVYPRFTPLANVDLPVGRKHQPGGLQMVSHVGDSEEFLGNREYRPGDRLRDIHHAAWARQGYPVVREFQQEYLCRIAMIVDTYVPKHDPDAEDALEAALSLSAAVADVLSRREYVIDIFAAGPDLYHFQAGRSLAYLDNILDILACIEGTHDNPFETLAPALSEELDQISTAVVVLMDWDEVRETFVRSLRDFGVAVKVILVRDEPPAFDPTGFVGEAGPVTVLTSEQARTGTERL